MRAVFGSDGIARGLIGAALIAGAATTSSHGQCEVQKLLPSQGGSGDALGWTVDVSGNVAIVGGFFANAAYVYRFDGSEWLEEARLEAEDAAPNALFGSAVAIDGNVAVVGASGDDENGGFAAGAVYVFRYEPDSRTWASETKLLASDGAPDNRFGFAVAVSDAVILAGAYGNDNRNGQHAGAAYAFRFNGSKWIEEGKLLSSDASTFLGRSAGIDDDLAVVGTLSEAAYVFRFDGRSWVQEAKLIEPEGSRDDNFGWSVAVSGDVVVVGAPDDDDNGGFSGSAFVFRLHCGAWELEAHLLASDGTSFDVFGASVAGDGDLVVVGAPGDGDNGPISGSAYFYRYDFDGAMWREETDLLASDGTAYDSLGHSVAVSGDIAILGADSDDDNGGSGSAYMFAGLLGNDCNGNGVADACDIDAGKSTDADGNGSPDECDCPWDVDGKGTVGIADLMGLLAQWGPGAAGPPDFDGDGAVSMTDLLALLANWGPCPLFADCNDNGVFDAIDIQGGTSPDCNGNAVPDECDVAARPDCNGNGIPDGCDLVACSSADCNGNAVPDECDIAGGTSWDSNGDGIPDECEFTADDCGAPAVIGDGAWPFFTFGATTDGPIASCEGSSIVPFLNDVWFLYMASFTGSVAFSLCNDADFDTALAVYSGEVCPSPGMVNPLTCSDDAIGCGRTSEVEVFAVPGLVFLLRVGSLTGEEGSGVLTVTSRPLP